MVGQRSSPKSGPVSSAGGTFCSADSAGPLLHGGRAATYPAGWSYRVRHSATCMMPMGARNRGGWTPSRDDQQQLTLQAKWRVRRARIVAGPQLACRSPNRTPWSSRHSAHRPNSPESCASPSTDPPNSITVAVLASRSSTVRTTQTGLPHRHHGCLSAGSASQPHRPCRPG